MKTTLLSICALGGSLVSAVEPLKVALYDGPGSAGKGVPRLTELLQGHADFSLTKLTPAQITTDLSPGKYEVIIFTGGSGGGQSKAITETGVRQVASFVDAGGGYVGICAGAYLACSNFSWGTKVLDAKTVSSKWRRGHGPLKVQLTEAGRSILGTQADTLDILYSNGPVIMPFGDDKTPDYTPLAHFRTELAENGTPVGVMVGSPAIAIGEKGLGRAIVISPHPEQTPGLDEMVRNAVRWAGKRPAKPAKN